MTAILRRARPRDAKPLSRLAETTFRDAFDTLNTPENMALHCNASYSEALQAAEIGDPAMLTLLCELDGRLLAYAQLRWGVPPTCVVAEAPGEIRRLYVDRECHGTGVAHDLMHACLDEMAVHGSDVVWLGVWEQNPRAIAFYKKFGFVEVGAHSFLVGTDPQRDIVMARPVA